MTNAELAILGLIAEKSSYGYELEQVIELRGMREWTEIGFSSIYYILKKLEKIGLVSATKGSSTQSGPARTTYTLTSDGREIWKKASLQALESPERAYRNLDLGLANIPTLPEEEVLKALLTYQQKLSTRREAVQAKSRLPHNQVQHVQIMFDLALSQINAELDWLDRTIEHLSNGDRKA